MYRCLSTFVFFLFICFRYHFSHDTLDRARDRARVKACIYMSFATVLGCIIMIMSGKKAAKRGESVSKSNLEWHRDYNEAAAAKERINKGI